MNGPAPPPATLYRPAEVAAMLRCSQWWVKEQARRRRIPFCWIGGSYLFTDEHIAAILRLFEVRPEQVAAPVAAVARPTPPVVDPSVRLRARAPRRARGHGTTDTTAA